ncbi:phage holin family protein [Klebsiella aerogenes]|uniref:phage holin family protein n=1 Tax=Klebsiella aerogenes TaxID=548 RepID=UPI001903CD1C|nr:hypothetical protein [Klebsiella aerogenes]
MLTNDSLIVFYFCITASAWGGSVRFLQTLKKRGKQSMLLLFTCQVMTSCFVGFVFFVLCLVEEINSLNTIMICAVAGSVGDRMLYLIWKKISFAKHRSF